MAKLRTVHRCTECGQSTAKWAGRCPSCGAWNSLVEDVEEVGGATTTLVARHTGSPGGATDVPLPIADVESTEAAPQPTGIDELDRVLGGGLVTGSVTLL